MAFEEEVTSYMIGGYALVNLLFLGCVIYLWITHKKTTYIWFILHLFFLTLSFGIWINILEYRAFSTSVENSFKIAFSGFFWAISMLCLGRGVWKLSPNPTKIRNEARSKTHINQ